MNTIGPVLRKARDAADLTQQEVADTLGVSLWTYNRLENGRRKFDHNWLEKLPRSMRRPVVNWLTGQSEQELVFLRHLAQVDRPVFVRRDVAPLPPPVSERRHFVRA